MILETVVDIIGQEYYYDEAEQPREVDEGLDGVADLGEAVLADQVVDVEEGEDQLDYHEELHGGWVRVDDQGYKSCGDCKGGFGLGILFFLGCLLKGVNFNLNINDDELIINAK